MYILVYYVPEEALEATKKALFNAGAGSIGNYSECSWQIKGEGQFRPGESSSPYSGEEGELFKVPEYRVEIALEEKYKADVVETLKNVHPYETPAWHLIKTES